MLSFEHPRLNAIWLRWFSFLACLLQQLIAPIVNSRVPSYGTGTGDIFYKLQVLISLHSFRDIEF